jgi:hypothetical protein
MGDGVATRSKLEEFKNVDYSFASSRECTFLEQLLNVRTYINTSTTLFCRKSKFFQIKIVLLSFFFFLIRLSLNFFFFFFLETFNCFSFFLIYGFRLLTDLMVRIFPRRVPISIAFPLSILGKLPYCLRCVRYLCYLLYLFYLFIFYEF